MAPPSTLFRARRRAFTLLEMLIVMVIIAILLGIVSGGLMAAINHAKRARGEAQLRDLLKAWTQYYAAYGQWPSGYDGTEKAMSYANLSPLFPDDTVNNGRAIPFLAIKIKSGEYYCDPWKNVYKVNFRAPEATNEAAMRISVAFPNRDRYRY